MKNFGKIMEWFLFFFFFLRETLKMLGLAEDGNGAIATGRGAEGLRN